MSLPGDHRVAMDAVVKLAVAAADPWSVSNARQAGPQGTDEPRSTELRAGHGRTHLRRARLGGTTTSFGAVASRSPAAAVG